MRKSRPRENQDHEETKTSGNHRPGETPKCGESLIQKIEPGISATPTSTRRSWLRDLSLAGLGAGLLPAFDLNAATVHKKPIPVDGSLLPVVGLGSWLTFDAPAGDARRRTSMEVVRAFFEAGGRMIDSSPMYGYSQDVIGQSLRELGMPDTLFSATKVWIPGADRGQGQMKLAEELWGVKRFDLLHVHNMVDWEVHLDWLLRWREEGRVGYTGITTSHGRRHAEMARVIRDQPFDFVQFSYNIANREAESTLLPMAQEHGKAVVINRPFGGGGLFRRVAGKPLPDWAEEIDCQTWAQFFLRFIVSHPAVTCAIPATSKVVHLKENMKILTGRLPDQTMRVEMVRYFDSLQ